MCGRLSCHFLNVLPVIFNLAQKERAIQRRPMTMSMQLDINAAGCKLADFVGRQVMHESLFEQSFIINIKLRGQ